MALKKFFYLTLGNALKYSLLIFYKKEVIKIGLCTFIGDEFFLEEIKKSLNYLKSIDKIIYNDICNFNATFTCGYGYSYENNHAKIYSINHEYRKWNEHGIILYIIYVYKRKYQSRENVLIFLADWIKQKEFPKRGQSLVFKLFSCRENPFPDRK